MSLILIVEDNEKNLKLVRDVLQVKGYQTLEAGTAELGLKIARERMPQLILMDIQLPGMSGIDALRALRAEPETAGIPVIATPVGGIPDFLKDGETGLFCKISDPGDLAGKVIKILKNKQLREKIINNSRLLITKKYDWDIIADEFSEIYERI